MDDDKLSPADQQRWNQYHARVTAEQKAGYERIGSKMMRTVASSEMDKLTTRLCDMSFGSDKIEIEGQRPMKRITASFVNASAGERQMARDARLCFRRQNEYMMQRMQTEAAGPAANQTRGQFPGYSAMPMHTGTSPSVGGSMKSTLDIVSPMMGPMGMFPVTTPSMSTDISIPNFNDVFPEAKQLGGIMIYDAVTTSSMEIFQLFRFEYTDAMEAELDVMVANPAMSDRAGYRIPPRLVSYRQSKRRFRLIMTQLGQSMEAYAFATRAGQVIWAFGEIQVERGFVETLALACYMEVLWAPYSTHMEDAGGERKALPAMHELIIEDQRVFDMFNRARNPYDLATKHLQTLIKRQIRRNIEGKYTLLVGQGTGARHTVGAAANAIPTTKTTFPAEPTASDAKVTRIIESRDFYDTFGEFDPFDATIATGKFIKISGTTDKIQAPGLSNVDFRTSELTRGAYCLETDSKVTITAMQAFRASGMFKEDGDKTALGRAIFQPGVLQNGKQFWASNAGEEWTESAVNEKFAQGASGAAVDITLGDLYTEKQLRTIVNCFADSLKRMDTEAKRQSITADGTVIVDANNKDYNTIRRLSASKAVFEAMIENDVPTFFQYLIVSQTLWNSQSTALVLGDDHCRTYTGKSMYKFQPPGDTNLYRSAMSLHSKANCQMPEQVAVSHLLNIRDYRSGDNGRFYVPKFNEGELETWCTDPAAGSYMVLVLPPGEAEFQHAHFDITGKYKDGIVRDQQPRSVYALAAFYTQYLGLASMARPDCSYVARDGTRHEEANWECGTIYSQAVELVSHPTTKEDVILTRSQAHEGAEALPGWRRRRREALPAEPVHKMRQVV